MNEFITMSQFVTIATIVIGFIMVGFFTIYFMNKKRKGKSNREQNCKVG